MNRRKHILPALIFLSTAALAQDKEMASVNYGISRLRYNDTSASARVLDIKIRTVLHQAGRSTVFVMAGYRNLDLDRFPDGYHSPLHGFMLQGAWLYRVRTGRTITLFAQAGLFSDLEDISAKDLRYGAGFRYRVRHSDKLSTGWGIGYSRQFFGNQIVPFIDLDYHPNEKWSLSGQFPVRPKLLYHFSKQLSAGIEISGDAASYRLSQSAYNNQFIQINQWTGLAKLECKLKGSWQLNLGIGRNFKQSYKLFNDATAASWTVITVPLGEKAEPVKKTDSKGMNISFGISFAPFDAR